MKEKVCSLKSNVVEVIDNHVSRIISNIHSPFTIIMSILFLLGIISGMYFGNYWTMGRPNSLYKVGTCFLFGMVLWFGTFLSVYVGFIICFLCSQASVNSKSKKLSSDIEIECLLAKLWEKKMKWISPKRTMRVGFTLHMLFIILPSMYCWRLVILQSLYDNSETVWILGFILLSNIALYSQVRRKYRSKFTCITNISQWFHMISDKDFYSQYHTLRDIVYELLTKGYQFEKFTAVVVCDSELNSHDDDDRLLYPLCDLSYLSGSIVLVKSSATVEIVRKIIQVYDVLYRNNLANDTIIVPKFPVLQVSAADHAKVDDVRAYIVADAYARRILDTIAGNGTRPIYMLSDIKDVINKNYFKYIKTIEVYLVEDIYGNENTGPVENAITGCDIKSIDNATNGFMIKDGNVNDVRYTKIVFGRREK